MRPSKRPEESTFSKVMFFGALIILVIILCICAYFIYGHINSHSGDPISSSAMPASVPTRIPTHTTLTPTPVLKPTLQIEPTPVATDMPAVKYESDTKVSDGLKIAMPPGIQDSYIVYDEIVGDNNYNIHLYDTKSLSDQIIGSGNERSFGAVGCGEVAIWNGTDNIIHMFNISDKTMVIASPCKNSPREFPNIFDNKLIFTSNDGNMIDVFSIYAYMKQDATMDLWAKNISEPLEPRGDGNNIVWWNQNNGSREVILYDIEHISWTKIAGANCDHPRISGNLVVYHNGADNHIYLYNIGDSTTRKIINVGRQYSADISGSKIVYDDNRDGNWNIYMYDDATGKERQLTNEPHDQMSPQICGDQVIYMDNRNGDWNIYTMKI
ncbi:MAG TPA: hypothetical protein VK436_05380 [Methanocella sp.]|nr:hypothetical protein [Methanocella sp.]